MRELKKAREDAKEDTEKNKDKVIDSGLSFTTKLKLFGIGASALIGVCVIVDHPKVALGGYALVKTIKFARNLFPSMKEKNYSITMRFQ